MRFIFCPIRRDALTRLFAYAAISVIAPACLGEGAVFVKDVTIVDGATRSFEVDTSFNVCISSNDDCFTETFTAAYAEMKVVNGTPTTDAEPEVVAREEVVTEYTAKFEPHDGAPVLEQQEGALRATLPADAESTMTVPLVSFSLKEQFNNDAGLTEPLRYSVHYTFKGQAGLEFSTAFDFLLGGFNKCPDGTQAAYECPPPPVP